MVSLATIPAPSGFALPWVPETFQARFPRPTPKIPVAREKNRLWYSGFGSWKSARGFSLFRGDNVKMVIELGDLSRSVFQEKKKREKMEVKAIMTHMEYKI